MLQVDLNQSDQRLAQTIKEQISSFGRVVSVNIHRLPSPFALVEMTQHAQTLELAARFGGSAFGTSALIHLAPTTQ